MGVPTGAVMLSAAYPNPFQRQANLTLTLSRPEPVHVSLYDALGRRVRVLHDGIWPAESPQTISILADGLPSGVYLIRVETTARVESRMVTVLR